MLSGLTIVVSLVLAEVFTYVYSGGGACSYLCRRLFPETERVDGPALNESTSPPHATLVTNTAANTAMRWGPPTYDNRCFLDVAVVALLHMTRPALFSLFANTSNVNVHALRRDIAEAHRALVTSSVPSGGWNMLQDRIRDALASKHHLPDEFIQEQQDARAAVAYLIDALHTKTPHLYDEYGFTGKRQTVAKTIYRETLLPAIAASRLAGSIGVLTPSLASELDLSTGGAVMDDIVVDGHEDQILRSMRYVAGKEDSTLPLCWFLGIRRITDIVKIRGMPIEILHPGRCIRLPIEIKVRQTRSTKLLKLQSIIMRTNGLPDTGHYTCVIHIGTHWYLYDGMSGPPCPSGGQGEWSPCPEGTGGLQEIIVKVGTGYVAKLPQELLDHSSIVGAYYQE